MGAGLVLFVHTRALATFDYEFANTVTWVLVMAFVRAVATVIPAIWFLKRPGVVLGNLRALMPAAVFVAYCLASVAWSNVPWVSLGRVLPYALTFWFGIYFALRYTVREQINLIWATVFFGCLVSLLFCAAFPAYGTMARNPSVPAEHVTLWRGLYGHKNVLCQVSVLLIVTSGLRIFERMGNRALNWISIPMGLVLIYFGHATTPIIVVAAAVPTFLYLYSVPRMRTATYMSSIILFLGAAAVFMTVGLVYGESIARYFNKDLTLTGRVPIWLACLDMLARRPWLGYGYNGFWKGSQDLFADFPEATEVYNRVIWEAPHAHNGLIEVGLDGGIVAVTLMLLLLLSTLAIGLRNLRASRGENSLQFLWPVTLILFTIFYNLSECSFSRGFFFLSMAVLSCSISLRVSSREERARRLERLASREPVARLAG
jgi:O-antigen ligase